MRTFGVALGAFAFLAACAGTERQRPETAPVSGKVLARQTLGVGSRCMVGPGCELVFDRVIRVRPEPAAGGSGTDFAFICCGMRTPVTFTIEPERALRDRMQRVVGSFEGWALRPNANFLPTVILVCALAPPATWRPGDDFSLAVAAKFQTETGEIIVPVTFRFDALDCAGQLARGWASLAGAWRVEGWDGLFSTAYDADLREEGAGFTGTLAYAGEAFGTVAGTADWNTLCGVVRYTSERERRFFGVWTSPDAAVGLWSDIGAEGAMPFMGRQFWYLARQ